MTEPEPERVLACALSIGDGKPVDWTREGAQTTDDTERRLLEGLRELSKVAHAFEKVRSAVGPAEVLPTTSVTEPAGAETARPAVARGGAPRTWGHLEVRKCVGDGGFGEVYLAWDPRLEREVALKLVRSGREDSSVLREARHLAQVRHRNVVTVFGADRHGERVGLWMELIKGRTLQDVVEEQGPFGAREAMLIGLDVCRALAALHGAGIVHRDVKANNVMREAGGRIVLMDLGAGLELNPDRSPRESTGGAGTLLYMAPEVLRGEAASVRSDLYGVGVLLYYLVSASFPLRATSVREFREAHERRRPIPLSDLRPDLPEAFLAVVERATSRTPADRFPTAGEMERALAAALGTRQVEPDGARRWKALAWTGAAAAAAAVLAVVLALSIEWDPAPPGLGVEASLYRHHEGQPLGEPLAPRATVRRGDRLYLEVRNPEPVHLYVVNLDPAGRAEALFPLDGREPANPLEPGPLHRLPGAAAGVSAHWVVDSVPGRESFVLVAAPERLPQLEAALDALEHPDRSRGVDLVEEINPARQELQELESVLRDLRGRASAGDVWFTQIDIDHEGP